MTAARTGNPDALKALIAHGANVNAKEGWQGETALMWAAAENHGEAVKVLAAAGADLNAHNALTEFPEQKFTTSGMVTTYLNRGGWTPLMYAARQDAKDAVKALIDAKADLNQVDDDGANALVIAIINAHFDTAGMLLDAGADPNVADRTGMAALYAAVDMHSLDVMFSRPMPVFPKNDVVALAGKLIARGANVNAQLKSPVLERHHNAGNQQMGEGTTPIIRASKNGDVEMMKLLLDHGARLDLTLKDHTNALMIAIASGAGTYGRSSGTESGAIQAVRLCIEHGVDVNATRDNGQTALHSAAGAGGDAVIKILAENGAKLDLKDKQGLTALDVASGRGGGGGRRGGGGGGGAGPGQARPTTVALLRQLMGLPAADAPPAQ
jgi:ankyrin repeat protein